VLLFSGNTQMTIACQ